MSIEMTREQKLFWEADACGKDAKKAYELFLMAAELWRKRNRYCSAGWAMNRAFYHAVDDDLQISCIRQASEDFLISIKTMPEDSCESLNALCKISFLIGVSRKSQGFLRQELAQRLFNQHSNTRNAENYLLKGFYFRTNFEEIWEVSFPDHEITSGVEGWGNPEGKTSMSCKGAFYMFLDTGDYIGAQHIIDLHPQWFNSPRLRGWKAGIEGFLSNENREGKFAEAEEAFGKGEQRSEKVGVDKKREIHITNDFLLSRHFGARKLVERARNNLSQAKDFIGTAAKMLDGREFAFVCDEMT